MARPEQPANSEERGLSCDVEVLEAFGKRLTDEYKMLQDKIDKIGAFRFTVKGWSVTAVIAASAAASSAKSWLTALTLCSGLGVMLVFFFLMELKQVRLSRLFGDRARRLEDAFVRIDRKRKASFKLPFPVPYLANEMAFAGKDRRVARSGRLNWLLRTRVFKWTVEQLRLWIRADLLFYLVLFCLAATTLIPRHADIARQWNHWMGKTPTSHGKPSGANRTP